MKTKCFISKFTKFVLIDSEGDIRGTATELEDIVLLKQEYGWGKIHRAKFDGKKLKIGVLVE